MQDWVALMIQGGATVVLAAWVWTLREQNRELIADLRSREAKYEALLERAVRGLHDGATAVQAVNDSVASTNTILVSLKDVMIVKGVQRD